MDHTLHSNPTRRRTSPSSRTEPNPHRAAAAARRAYVRDAGTGAHLLYALSGGAALSRLAGAARFGPHHCAVYAANAFLGPDLGSFAEWLASFLPSSSSAAAAVGDLAMGVVHHPFYYPLLLGFPLACLYAWLSRRLLLAGVLDEPSRVGAPPLLLIPSWICFPLI